MKLQGNMGEENMRHLQNYTVFAILVIFLSACATMPDIDTNNKRLESAEISLQELSLFVLNSKDRMSDSIKATVKELINDSHKALKAARLALSIGDELDFSNSLSTANTLIATLRPILLELE